MNSKTFMGLFLLVGMLQQAIGQVTPISPTTNRHYLGVSSGFNTCFGILNINPFYAPSFQLNYSLEQQEKMVYSARLSYFQVFEFQLFGKSSPANSLSTLEIMVGKTKQYKSMTMVPSAGIAINRFAIRTGYSHSSSSGMLSSESYYNTEAFTKLGVALSTAFKFRLAKTKHRYLYVEPQANINLYCPVYGFNVGFQGCL